MFARDPISVQFDGAAARLLRNAYKRRRAFEEFGDIDRYWSGTYVANPSRQWELWALSHGWGRLLGPDNAPGGDARTRWCRAYIRSLHNLNRKFMTSRGLHLEDTPRPWGQTLPFSMQYRVGTVRLSSASEGPVRVIGRAVRIRLLTPAESRAFAATIPDSKRWITEDGKGPRYAGWTYQA